MKTYGNYGSFYNPMSWFSASDSVINKLKTDEQAIMAMSKEEKINRARSGLLYYFNEMRIGEGSTKPTFDEFVATIFYDTQLKKSFVDEDLPALGEQFARYIQMNNKDEGDLKDLMGKLAHSGPEDYIAPARTFYKVIASDSFNVSMSDYAYYTKEAMAEAVSAAAKAGMIIVNSAISFTKYLPYIAVGIAGLFLYNYYKTAKKVVGMTGLVSANPEMQQFHSDKIHPVTRPLRKNKDDFSFDSIRPSKEIVHALNKMKEYSQMISNKNLDESRRIAYQNELQRLREKVKRLSGKLHNN
jgi:hypothetical protein